MQQYKEAFVGRKNQIDEFFTAFEKRQNPAFVIIGESGIGKSSYLDEIVRRIRELSSDKHVFVGINRVLDGTTNPASPFVRVIDDLMSNLEVTFQVKIDKEGKRFLSVCEKVFSEKGKS